MTYPIISDDQSLARTRSGCDGPQMSIRTAPGGVAR